MNKQDEFFKMQTCVLKVNIHCNGCKEKVKKKLHKVDGVFKTTIDAEQGIVTVFGNPDPATLIKKLNKAGKHAELLHPKGIHITQLQKLQQDNQKSHQNKNHDKHPKSLSDPSARNGKDQKPQANQLHHNKGFKDLKFPNLKDLNLKLPFQKDSKSVKFDLPPENYDDCSDEDDFDDDDEYYDDEEDMEEFDSLDADFDEDFRNLKLKNGSAQNHSASGAIMMPDKKNGKKGVQNSVQFKGVNGNNDAKSAKKGGGGGASQNHGSKNTGKVDAAQDHRNPANNGAPKPNHNSARKGPHGGGPIEGPAESGGPMGRPGGFPTNMNGRQMGFMPPQGSAAGAGAGFPPGVAPPGYYPAGGMPTMNPEMMAGGGTGNTYQQQQYIAAMMQQQQRMMMNGQDRGYPPMMGYPRPPPPAPAAMYMAQPTTYSEPYNYFSDENANSCSIM